MAPRCARRCMTRRRMAEFRFESVSKAFAAKPAVSDLARDVTFVFQQYSLYPHLTVYDNLAFPLRSPARRWSAQRIDAKVREVAQLLHIEEKLAQRATHLSGGQMQRVAIGRALVRAPRV